jgi:hypothetical protein
MLFLAGDPWRALMVAFCVIMLLELGERFP